MVEPLHEVECLPQILAVSFQWWHTWSTGNRDKRYINNDISTAPEPKDGWWNVNRRYPNT